MAMDQATSMEVREVFYGRVKSYNFTRGFGFLEAPAVQALYGRDVFMRQQAVEELMLSRIASGSGPDAEKDRGEMFVSFLVKLNEAGKPEAEDVREARVEDLPQELLQLPPLSHRMSGYPESCREKECKEESKAKAKASKDALNKGKKSKGKGTSEGHLELDADCRIRVGRDAAENWDILEAAKRKHWFFHLTDFSSCYVILECSSEPSPEEKQQCAKICREHSQKSHRAGPMKVDATPCGNVKFDRRRDAVGECEYKDESKVEVLIVE